MQEIKEVEKKTEGLLQQFSKMRLQEDQIRSYNTKINQHMKGSLPIIFNLLVFSHKVNKSYI